jgi:hypothetical protein
MPETLYLTVNLIDRYLEAKPVTRRNLQLVNGMASSCGRDGISKQQGAQPSKCRGWLTYGLAA